MGPQKDISSGSCVSAQGFVAYEMPEPFTLVGRKSNYNSSLNAAGKYIGNYFPLISLLRKGKAGFGG